MISASGRSGDEACDSRWLRLVAQAVAAAVNDWVGGPEHPRHCTAPRANGPGLLARDALAFAKDLGFSRLGATPGDCDLL